MHGPIKKTDKRQDGFFERWGTGFVVLPVLMLVSLLVIAIFQPKTSNWIAEIVQKEFPVETSLGAEAPAQAAQSGMEMRTVSRK